MTKIAFYRKYRPDNFDQTVGQGHIVTILKNAILENRFSHAYLFTGPRGTGKTSFARIMAKSINCESKKDYNPCGKCSICLGINEGRVLDLVEIDAASNRGIDEIRDLREKAKFSPTECKFKIFIIDEVHMLTKEAFNALLKTLEEPPAHAIFILATTEINKVPATIISRCQRHDFKRIKNIDIVNCLSEIKNKEKVRISDEALEEIALASDGGLRDAISLLDQLSSAGVPQIGVTEVEEILGLAPHELVRDFAASLIEGNNRNALELIGKASTSGTDLVIFTKTVQDFLRKILTVKIGDDSLIEGTSEQIQEIKDFSISVDQEVLVKILDSLFEAQRLFKNNIDPKSVMTLICAKNYKNSGVETVATIVTETRPLTKKTSEQKDKKIASNGNGKWQHVLMEVKQKNNTIHAVLRVANPVFEENVLTLGFPYKFHKERVEEKKTKNMLEEIVSKVYGQTIEIKCDMNESVGGNNKIESVSDAASILGGEVVA